jgi:hypothetical protein
LQNYKNKSLQYFFNPGVIRDSLPNALAATHQTFEQESSLFEYASHPLSPADHQDIPTKYRGSKREGGAE